MNVFFTSDLHLGHRLVSRIRGFATPEEHDAVLVENWTGAVAADDEVWVLGDIAVASPSHALKVLRGLPGRKHLISGNHDATHPMNRNAHKHLRTFLEVFDSVASAARRRIAGTDVLLSHFPYERDREAARETQWRLRDEGRWLLHGHTHGTERLTPEYKEIHVGLDAWDLRPVPLTAIERIVSGIDPATLVSSTEEVERGTS